MRLKTWVAKEAAHRDLVTCVGWSNAEEAFSCGDDHAFMRWNLVTNESDKVCDLPAHLYPTDLHWFPRVPGTATKKQGTDVALVTSADGKFHLVNRNGRVEKSVEAHKGATLSGRWSFDGTSLLTAGEDGQVKIWSRGGMLRSTVVQAGSPVYCAVWGPDSNQVLYTLDRSLVVKPLAPNSKANRWKAHEGLILKVAWNPSNNLIISGGEDCRYKVWDPYGRQLYGSGLHEHPVTSLAWTPSGDLFAVGSFNSLRLCDKTGWSYSLDKPDTGSIYNLSWSSDETQVAGACGNGHVIFAHVIERRLEWRSYEATVTGRRTVSVRDVSDETREELDFPDRVIKVALGHGHLVVATPAQCHVYSTRNWNTPTIVDLREGSVSMILLAARHFLLVEKTLLCLYNYEGRLLCSPKWEGMQPETLNSSGISISSDTVCVRDQLDDRVLHLFEVGSGSNLSALPDIVHTAGVAELGLSQSGERQVALVDRNRDLYVGRVRATGHRLRKLGSMVQSLRWNCDTNILAAVQDVSLTVWYYPAVTFVDRRLVAQTTLVKDASDLGKNPVIVSFVGNHLGVRRADGALVNASVSPFPSVLHGYADAKKWQDALRLCRYVRDPTLWACLAAMALHARDLDTAEEAYAAIGETDKVFYIQRIKTISSKPLRAAEVSLLGGNPHEAESVLLQNGLTYRAIDMHLRMHNWNRALEVAVKHKSHVDTVLYQRRKYLSSMDKGEKNEKFLQFKEMELDEDKILTKMKLESEKEL